MVKEKFDLFLCKFNKDIILFILDSRMNFTIRNSFLFGLDPSKNSHNFIFFLEVPCGLEPIKVVQVIVDKVRRSLWM